MWVFLPWIAKKEKLCRLNKAHLVEPIPKIGIVLAKELKSHIRLYNQEIIN